MASAVKFELRPEPEPNTLRAQGQQFDGRGECMARRRYQHGSVFWRGRKKKKWIGRWREDIVAADGTVHRVRHSAVLGLKGGDLSTEKMALRRLDLILDRIKLGLTVGSGKIE